MGKRKNGKSQEGNSGLALSAEALKGRQSVRATFRLPDRIIELLSLVAAQLGLQQKSLFDQLVEDAETLARVAEEAHGHDPAPTRRQKTYVLSRKSLLALDRVARQQRIARDVLVEFSIQRLLPVINAEQERHEKRKLIHKEMEEYLRRGREILKKADTLLGEDDRISVLIRDLVTLCEKDAAEIGRAVEKGKRMESFNRA